MNANKHIAPSIGKVWIAAPFAVLVIAMLTIACSTKAVSKSNATSSAPTGGSLRPAAMRTAVVYPAPTTEAMKPVAKPAEKPSPNKLLSYRSRDYGISFQYPWQYSVMGARAVANGDSSLRPVSDGYDGQVTLVRVEIPKGFYADTNFQSGYFMLSLNANVDQQECEQTLGLGKDGKVLTDSINGVDFRWRDSETGGHGQASKVRQYVAFTNDTCYELELGVKTGNPDGLARDVDPDQVLRRLDTILKTVKIQSDVEKPAAEGVKTFTAVAPSVSQH
jgi:hypothetical protein